MQSSCPAACRGLRLLTLMRRSMPGPVLKQIEAWSEGGLTPTPPRPTSPNPFPTTHTPPTRPPTQQIKAWSEGGRHDLLKQHVRQMLRLPAGSV